ncbi:hypothetical protein HCJ76_44325 [Streptomyces sp. MC1]|uniref:hypothetical protein n=1 Tax=Streptomyces sp. MC1 TaxID=295105 RepID=UPI0018CB9136|nr:hypothetical protein [Streptomyces sp. MC1]MBG7704912.1 hypothetical protein [Streptomyces sp. MC1]
MREGEWRLSYSSYDNYPGANLTFGREDSGIYCLTEPDVTFADMDTADASLPGEDGVRMGRDYQRNATVSFELGVDGARALIDRHYPRRPWASGDLIGDWTELEAIHAVLNKSQSVDQRTLDGVSMLRSAWHADGLREKAGRVAWLVHRFGGRQRRLYGRPRKFAVAHSRFTKQGYTPVAADFVAVDDRFYDDTAKEEEMYDHVRVTLPPRPGRPTAEYGWDSKKTAAILHEGDVNTFPYIEIWGPCTNPKVTFGPNLWAVQLSMSISSGDHVTIDPRPWQRTVTHYKGSSTSSVADKLTRASPRLAKMYLPPGYWNATMSFTRFGPPLTGPRVRIVWRDAHAWW